MYKKWKYFNIFSLITIGLLTSNMAQSWAQTEKKVTIKGVIKDQREQSIPQVNLIDLDGKLIDITDIDGSFELSLEENSKIVLHATGYAPDTITVKNWEENRIITLQTLHIIDGVEIHSKQKGTEFDQMSTVKSYLISSNELAKSACCNLSESFETTPAVDVGFSDGVTGYKTIQLLGLSGPNTLYTREGIPDLRGLASIIGLTFTPGTWVESMQLSKGAGSVKHSFEGSAGQINVEWPKPFLAESPRLYINGYQNSHARSELNAIWNHALSSKTSTSLLAHYSNNWLETDANNDGFRDSPLGQNVIVSNRWIHFGNNGWEVQAGAKGIYLNQEGGSMKSNESQSGLWRYENDIQRLETWAKIGKTYEAIPWKSMGLQLSYIMHDQESRWHNNSYKGKQSSFSANYLYETIIANTFHQVTVGSQIMSDLFNESWNNNTFQPLHYTYIGAFGEYNYSPNDNFNVQVGLRGDVDHEGFFFTPRVHIRKKVWEGGIARLSAGRAKRNVHPFSEFSPYFASNRQLEMEGYGTDMNQWAMEDAWNSGISLTQDLTLAGRPLTISLDAYYTNYQRQIIADILTPGTIKIYEVAPGSEVWSSQAEVHYEPINRLEFKASYRFQHIDIPYQDGQQLAYLHAPHKGFLNVGYSTRNNWSFDATFHVIGEQKVPYHPGLPESILASGKAPAQYFLNAQVTKSWQNGKFDVYLGVENITNQMQDRVILHHENINSPLLDASMIYGSPVGRLIYTGFRYRL